MNPRTAGISRRNFLQSSVIASSAIALAPTTTFSAVEAHAEVPFPIVVFSKVYQELKLNFTDAAEMTAAAGLDGVDCPVRPGGEILPELAADQLPRYADALRQHKLGIHLLTTGITSTSSPSAEAILRTAKKLGVQYYRLGFIQRKQDLSGQEQAREVRPQLKDLAAVNREIGICGLLQNHSSSGASAYFGGNLAEMVQAVEGFDPAEIGVAFDIGHALVMHGSEWRRYFEQLKPHFRVAYIKDVKPPARWVAFGRGDIASTGYFQMLRDMHYNAPVSLHIEFNWADEPQGKTRQNLAKALAESTQVLRGWLKG